MGARPVLDRAGVETWEVMEVLYSPRRWPRSATTPDGTQALTVWGRTDDGRALIVVLRRLRADSRWQILMAAPMRPHQLAEFTAWEATRNE
ncbi:hypothetical protein F6W96_40000 [Nocardia terpenica]|uniref:BrnT family toxin n=1 Tax=Nocardia terpenica TaxID=455432 RepID=A0A6G9ZID7_9NOCA|nr:hypothetical protein F6W96_40000 [Nocardia terpenica]